MLAIVNPAAGGGGKTDLLVATLDRIRAAGIALDVTETGPSGPDATQLAGAAVTRSYDGVLGAGGDGTVAAVARALVGTEVVLGILPFGTFMNIARALGVPREQPLEAADVVVAGAVRRIDVGVVGGEPFFEAAGIGLDADAIAIGRAAQRGALRRAAALGGQLLRRPGGRVEIEIDGATRRFRLLQAVVSNGPFYGWGFDVAPDARVDDGMLDLTVFVGGRLGVLRDLVLSARGPQARRGLGFRARRIVMRSRGALRVHADGRLVGILPQTFEVRPGALRVFAPGGQSGSITVEAAG